MNPETVFFKYRNYKNHIAVRTVKPLNIWFGSTKYHPEPQWFLHAFDL